jgi:hypothetical protein
MSPAGSRWQSASSRRTLGQQAIGRRVSEGDGLFRDEDGRPASGVKVGYWRIGPEGRESTRSGGCRAAQAGDAGLDPLRSFGTPLQASELHQPLCT